MAAFKCDRYSGAKTQTADVPHRDEVWREMWEFSRKKTKRRMFLEGSVHGHHQGGPTCAETLEKLNTHLTVTQ